MQLSTQLMPHGHFTQPLCSGNLFLMRNRGIISIPLPEPIHSGQSLHPHHKPWLRELYTYIFFCILIYTIALQWSRQNIAQQYVMYKNQDLSQKKHAKARFIKKKPFHKKRRKIKGNASKFKPKSIHSCQDYLQICCIHKLPRYFVI